ncbi:MAG: hypothetical protein BRD41_02175 [Bacteroidetes bacterium QS_1_63_11]|nr:MAG: hypothetical protein BRD41_02175 [Bacteroidetes bacterium QS_1_63_11]
MLRRLLIVLIVGCVAPLLAAPAAAQESNIDTIEGPGTGESTTLTVTPHELTDDVSARAIGIERPNGLRLALTLIGTASADSIGLTLGDEPLPIEDISRPDEDEVGPTRVYLSQETFLTIADTPEVRLHIGDATANIPDQMRKEMRMIFDKVV